MKRATTVIDLQINLLKKNKPVHYFEYTNVLIVSLAKAGMTRYSDINCAHATVRVSKGEKTRQSLKNSKT